MGVVDSKLTLSEQSDYWSFQSLTYFLLLVVSGCTNVFIILIDCSYFQFITNGPRPPSLLPLKTDYPFKTFPYHVYQHVVTLV